MYDDINDNETWEDLMQKKKKMWFNWIYKMKRKKEHVCESIDASPTIGFS